MAGEPSTTAKLIAEFIGTFLLIFTIGCNILSGSGIWAGVSIACVLMVSIFAFGSISGANFNPAVSVALGINGNLDWMTVGMYSAVQLVGGILAGVCYFGLFGKSFQLGPGKGFNGASAGVCEVLYTFMLCFVVLNVAAVKKGCQTWFGLAIGFVIVAGAYGAGAVSGGCFNPAVAVGIDVAGLIGGHGFGWCAIYAVCEIVGAALAAGLFKVVRPNGGEENEEYGTISKLASEFIGTYMLVLTVGLNVLGKSPAGAFSIAASLMCMIYALGDVSGANFNPAVTVAILMRKAIEPAMAGMYIGAQLLGGIAAAFTYSGIHGLNAFPLDAQPGYHMSQALQAEMMFTFVLCLVVLCTAVESKTKSENFFGLAIGSCVTVGGLAIGGISGGSLNPAVSFGIALSAVGKHGAGVLVNACLYSAFEILGGVIAALAISTTHATAEEGEKGEKEPITA